MAGSETRFAILLFTDIVGSADLKMRHGVPAFRDALRTHNGHFERLARECRGIRILQNMGDGYFAAGDSVAEAVKFALLFQDAMRAGPWGEVPLTTRVGIHAGEISAFEAEGGSGIVGPTADLAARVMSLAAGGQILLTRFPFDEARPFLREHPAIVGRPMPPLRWLAHGPYLLKGRDEPMDIFEVGAEGLAPLVAPPDGDKARRAIRPGEEETLGWRPAVGLEIPGRTGWHLTERLGAGGFGEVWAGEHAKLHQSRAFKFCFDDERLRALKREVTLVRLLRSALGDRDDIVHLHELKLDAPPFYLESDLAPHGNLLQWAEKQGGLGQIPLAQRIALVAHTATALAAAHSIGVLHKDIKPTNILIFDAPDGEPRPRLVDFGIGTLADPEILARQGITGAGFTRLTIQHSTGTPTYSPPEYLAGRPYTIQGDIYGLGILLYQLVTARPLDPLAPGWERDIADPLLREDIATCVDGDPAGRFPSAADLGDRLLHLEDRRAKIAEQERLEREAAAATEAVAVAESARARARHSRRLAAAFSVLAAIALAAGIWARRKQGDEARQRMMAEEARDAAQNLITEAIFGLREKLLPTGKLDAIEGMVEAAETYYAKLPGALKTDESERHRGSLYLNRALIAAALGKDIDHERYAREALGIARQLAQRRPDSEQLQKDIAGALLTLAYVFYDRADYESVEGIGTELVANCERWLKAHPDSAWALQHEILARNHVALSMLSRGALPQGTAEFQTAGDLAKRLRAITGETAEVCEAEGLIHYGSAKGTTGLKMQEKSLAEWEAAVTSFARARELGGDSALLRKSHASSLANAAGALLATKRNAQDTTRAELFMRQAFEQRQKLVELEPARAEWWRDLAGSHSQMGNIEKDLATVMHHREESVRCRLQAVQRQPNRPILHFELAAGCSGVARELESQQSKDTAGRAEHIYSAIQAWLRGAEMMHGPARVWQIGLADLVTQLVGLIGEERRAGAVPIATAHYERAQKMIEAALPKCAHVRQVGEAHVMLLTRYSALLSGAADIAAAAEVCDALERAAALNLGVEFKAKVQTAILPCQLRHSVLLARSGETAAAMKLAEQVVAKQPAALTAESDRELLSGWDSRWTELVRTLREHNALNEAVDAVHGQIAVRGRIGQLRPPNDRIMNNAVSLSHHELATIHLARDKRADADTALRDEVLAAEASGRPLELSETHARIGNFLMGKNRRDEADVHIRKAWELGMEAGIEWDAMRFAADLVFRLLQRHAFAEAAPVIDRTWTASQGWRNDQQTERIRFALAAVQAFLAWHAAEPSAGHDRMALQWLERQAEFTNHDARVENDWALGSFALMWKMARRVEAGQIDEYKAERTQLIAKVKGIHQKEVSERIAKIILLLPAEGDELAVAVQLADFAYQAAGGAQTTNEWCRLAQGLAHYRGGRAKEAIAVIAPALKTNAPDRSFALRAVSAMAHRQLGDEAACKALLDKCAADDTGAQPFLRDQTNWNAGVARVLLREAGVGVR
jgi:class 3 adenylate cyclase